MVKGIYLHNGEGTSSAKQSRIDPDTDDMALIKMVAAENDDGVIRHTLTSNPRISSKQSHSM